jgi:hypothetical protein
MLALAFVSSPYNNPVVEHSRKDCMGSSSGRHSNDHETRPCQRRDLVLLGSADQESSHHRIPPCLDRIRVAVVLDTRNEGRKNAIGVRRNAH